MAEILALPAQTGEVETLLLCQKCQGRPATLQLEA